MTESVLIKTRSIVEILAITLGGLYFAFQVLAGSFVVSMEVLPKIEKTEIDGSPGYILSLELKKGSYGSVNLKDIQYHVRDAVSGNEMLPPASFSGITKLNTSTLKSNGKGLRFSPGDKMVFSEAFLLNTQRPFVVDVYVSAIRDFGLMDSHWRSQVIYHREKGKLTAASSTPSS